MKAEVLSISNAHKQFGPTTALDGADVTLQKGEWLALLGPNGAGKTTLIRAIAGRVRLDAGEMTLFSQTLDGAQRSAASINKVLGIVPQEIALYPLLTARENLQTFGELSGMNSSSLNSRVEWALEWTGLKDRARDRVKTFSGGMRRRLNLACSVLHEPQIILLDEPTVGVDPQSRERIWEMLGELRHQGASLLLTTHQLDEAQQVADRITIIDHGKTIATGSFHKLLSETIGTERRITFQLDEEAPDALIDAGFEAQDSRQIQRSVSNIAGELPQLLQQIEAAGARINDIHIESPTLQAVFIHLTGRELRE